MPVSSPRRERPRRMPPASARRGGRRTSRPRVLRGVDPLQIVGDDEDTTVLGQRPQQRGRGNFDRDGIDRWPTPRSRACCAEPACEAREHVRPGRARDATRRRGPRTAGRLPTRDRRRTTSWRRLSRPVHRAGRSCRCRAPHARSRIHQSRRAPPATRPRSVDRSWSAAEDHGAIVPDALPSGNSPVFVRSKSPQGDSVGVHPYCRSRRRGEHGGELWEGV